MKLFNSIRLAYFDEIISDPNVEHFLESRPIRITSPYHLKDLVNKCRGYNFFFSLDMDSAEVEMEDPPHLSACGTLERCTIAVEKYPTVVTTAGNLEIDDGAIKRGTLWVSINTTDPEFKIFYLWIDPETELDLKTNAFFRSKRLAYFEEATADVNLINITGIDNYTPEICEKIKALCEAGLTDSYPDIAYKSADPFVIWKRLDGVKHRSDGLPAFESKTRTVYYENGNVHRLDGPAKIQKTHEGITEEWFLEGKKSRLDGPAVEIRYNDGIRLKWYKDDVHYFNNEPDYPASYIEEIKRDFPEADAAYWAGKLNRHKEIIPKDWN